jgi:UDP-N-acetylglucosamine 4,6-dehydratase
LRLVDLARILAPDSPTETVGARAGEKIHETLLSGEESPRALELEDLYLILPSPPGDDERALYPGARPVAPGFRYTSDTNSAWWSPEEIRPYL